MKPDLFNFLDYQAYLSQALPTQGENRGARVKLAQALNVQKGFISAVLHGDSHFNLEQAIRVTRFLAHTEKENEYFLLLVQYARAGSEELKKHFKKKIEEILIKRREVRERISSKTDLSEADQTVYYSTWHHAAVHLCLMISKLQTPESMARYLGLQVEAVSRVLEFLVKTGLAKHTGHGFSAGPTRIHLPSNSPLVAKHHTNWRIQAIQALDRPKPRNLHYSLVMSISEDAAEKIRTILLEMIQKTEPVLKQAQDEAIYALSLDLFDLEAGNVR